MNTLNDTTHQDARHWSAQLGATSAELAAARSRQGFHQPGGQAGVAALPQRVVDLLTRVGQRTQSQEHAADQLRAKEFMMEM